MSNYEMLNEMQKEAVFCTEGPLLVLAGAGSGKTRVLTHRIAYLMEEKQVNPWNILAITFTNKAAGEMRERVDKQVEHGAESVWVSTFHSMCVRILRRHIEFLGYETNFSIYDTDDQKTLLKQVYKNLKIDSRMYKERVVLGQISHAKDRLISPEKFLEKAGTDYYQRKVGEIYLEYQKALKKNNALDFDDLIVKCVELLICQPQVLDYYQERFRYIMVDEYQDTNRAQFELVRLLAGKYKNLCVVGDDDQSIYKFRGADVGNILSFEESYPGARVIKLEQNYRSTQNILDAANGVIKNNRGRKEKTLWTANGQGEKICYRQFDQAYEEADFIVRDILRKEYPYQDCAVLYRTNAQSRLLEEKCLQHNIPYRLVGGVNFYQRKEIKDILSYLKTIANGNDDLAVNRIINVPKRGIGAATMGKITIFASANDYSLYDALLRARVVPGVGKAADKIGRFTDLIQDFRRRLENPEYSLRQLMEEVLEETGYKAELDDEDDVEGQSRLENIEELVNKAVLYAREAEAPSLNGFLEEVALVAEVDQLDASENRVTLMTLHSAKGLEFDHVYLSGLEDGLFPSFRSVASDDPGDVEEERRLCYVGITRAKKTLVLTAARMRMINGETRYSKTSRFLKEVPAELLTESRLEPGLSERTREFDRLEEKTDGGLSFDARFENRGFGSGNTGKPAFGKTFTVEKSKSLDYQAGDRVRHVKFGLGTVEEVKDGARDFEVTVNFDTVGQKRMFASFAKLEKAEEPHG